MVRVRQQPRISATKLAEYLTAKPTRQERILGDQKRPPDVKVALYRPAEVALQRAFCSGRDEAEVVREELLAWGRRKTTKWEIQSGW